MPSSLQTLSITPRIYMVDDFATQAEIDHILKIADDVNERFVFSPPLYLQSGYRK